MYLLFLNPPTSDGIAQPSNLKKKINLLFYIGEQLIPGGSVREESAYNAGDLGLIPGSERFPGEGKGDPLQYSCLENSMNRGAWQPPVYGITKSQT